MQIIENDDFVRVPGLFRLWDLQFVLNRIDDYQVHYHASTDAGLPLFALYRRDTETGV